MNRRGMMLVLCAMVALVAIGSQNNKNMLPKLERWPDERNIERESTTASSRISSSSTKEFPHKYVHTIWTRFMQYQPNLIHLGLARLKLFEAFCLPTIIGQQTKVPFLWLIYADPDLHDDIKLPLLQMLGNRSNFILIPSNDNRSIQGMKQVEKTQHSIWSGDPQLLGRFHRASLTKPILNTRLDADDGLALGYLNTVQESVEEMLAKGQRDDYKFWCVKNHVEWHPINADQTTTSPWGSVHTLSNGSTSNTCLTPGLTMFLNSGITPLNITNGNSSSISHTRVAWYMPPCNRTRDIAHRKVPVVQSQYNDEANCWRHIYFDAPGALRVRSTTSAGLAGVVVASEEQDQQLIASLSAVPQEVIDLEARFGVNSNQVREAKEHLQREQQSIASDNLKGQQCKRGYTCRQERLDRLKALSDPRDGSRY